MIEHGNADGGLVNDNFKDMDAILQLVRAGELQRHGMTVTSLHGNIGTRSRATRAAWQDLELEALNWYWLDELENVGERLEGCYSCRLGKSCVRT